jgi:branched-chain amino acid aminotransferase
MKPAADAAKDGYSQVLWLFGDNDEVTEVGAIELTKWQRIIFY